MVRNLPEFYDAFGVKEGDKLWLPPEQPRPDLVSDAIIESDSDPPPGVAGPSQQRWRSPGGRAWPALRGSASVAGSAPATPSVDLLEHPP